MNVPGQPVRVIVRALFDGGQWTAPDSFRRTLAMVDVIVMDARPELGEAVEGLLADEFDPDSYTARAKAAADSFGDAAYLVIGERVA